VVSVVHVTVVGELAALPGGRAALLVGGSGEQVRTDGSVDA
jgi:hypothetical protein